MKRYLLFLDEILPANHFDHFSLVGFAVSHDDYQAKLVPEMDKLKIDLFGNTNVVLHEKEVNDARKTTPFGIFQVPGKKKEMWDRVCVIFTTLKLPIFAVSIHSRDYPSIYGESRDPYHVALQLILENFLHFLVKNDGCGDIQLESTNTDPDQKDEQLTQHFHYLKANGTLFYGRRVIQRRLGSFSVNPKTLNIVGLQLADLLPNTINRHLSNGKYPLRSHSLINVIQAQLYDGDCGNTALFGHKIIP